MTARACLLALAALLLAGCGFRPLYADAGPARAARASLALGSIGGPDLDARAVREAWFDRLDAAASGRYRLDMAITPRIQNVSIQIDASALRNNYQLTANWKLVDTEAGKVVLDEESTAFAAYSVLDAQYASLIAERDGRSRAAGLLADDILRRVEFFIAAAERE